MTHPRQFNGVFLPAQSMVMRGGVLAPLKTARSFQFGFGNHGPGSTFKRRANAEYTGLLAASLLLAGMAGRNLFNASRAIRNGSAFSSSPIFNRRRDRSQLDFTQFSISALKVGASEAAEILPARMAISHPCRSLLSTRPAKSSMRWSERFEIWLGFFPRRYKNETLTHD